ncbi:MAG: Gldg family protein [Candidatus Helarchaeota archaeon]
MSVLIGFDISHSERGNLENTYKTLKKIADQKLISHKEYPIELENISDYQIFVIAQPTNFFTPEEINEIVKFVEIGGGLLILGDTGGDKAHRSNLNDLITNFGVRFNEDKVIDNTNYLGEDDIVIIKELKMHPIFGSSVKEIIYPKGCSLEIFLPNIANAIAWSSNLAIPPNKAVIATSKRKFGRVVISGSFSLLRYDSKGGIDMKNNSIVIKNIFNWLVTKERIQEIKAPKIEFKIPNILKKPKSKVSEEIETISTTNEDIKNQIISILEIIESLKATQKDFGLFKMLQKRFEFLVKMISKRLNIAAPTTFKQKLAAESTNVAIINKKIKDLELKKDASANLKEYITNQYNLKVISDSDFTNKIDNINKEIKEINEKIDLLKSKLRIIEDM